MWADLKFRLRALFDRAALERELDDELRFHLERETEKLASGGLSRAEAERRARLAFGGLDRIKDDARDARGVVLLDTLRQDLRYAWRGIASRPGFAVAVILTLALGIGANTAMFGIVDRLLLRPPAYLRAPERVHRVFVAYQGPDGNQPERTMEYTRYADFKRWTSSFDLMGAFALRSVAIGDGGDAREMSAAAMSASVFDFFDARPVVGRFFEAEEDRTPVGAPVAVLSHSYWQSRYGGRMDAIGGKLHVATTIYTIIGVAPEGFVGFAERETPAIFVPVTAVAGARNQTYFQNYNWGWLEVFARRKPDISIESANADLTAAYGRSWEAERAISPIQPAETAKPRAMAASLHLGRTPEASADAKVVTWVMGVAAIVLLIACANVANLLLARALKRRREIALRLALGVSRRRLVQQLLTESLLLAALGGVAGIMVAHWGGRTLHALFLRADDVGVVMNDGRTLAFASIVTVVVALFTGVAPALQALRGDVAGALKAGAREGTYRRSRMRSGLLLFQGALSVVLLVGAGLFVRSLSNVRSMRLGYDVDPVVYMEANTRGANLTAADQNALNDRLLAAAASTPGVLSASLTISVPFWSNEGRGLFVPGVDSVRKLGRFMLQAGSPTYFATLGTRIVRGRAFTDADRAGTERVVVVSEGMGRVLWPGKNAIGQQFRIGSDSAPFTTVIGIAEDMRGRNLTGDPEFWYYLPTAQYVAAFGTQFPSLFARVDGRAEDYVELLRRRLQREMPGAGYVNVMPLRNLVSPRQRSWEFGAKMFTAFGVLALALAAIGLYSVIAYAVAQRTHELGVRIALGAGTPDVLRMIVGQGLAFAAAGVAIGSVIALWASRWIEPLLFSQSTRDPRVYAVVAVLLLVVALMATLRPALRATRVDPTVALRSD